MLSSLASFPVGFSNRRPGPVGWGGWQVAPPGLLDKTALAEVGSDKLRYVKVTVSKAEFGPQVAERTYRCCWGGTSRKADNHYGYPCK